MRAGDTARFVSHLLGGHETSRGPVGNASPLVKICGTRTAQAAKTAIEAGADLIGMILVPGRRRTVSPDMAEKISAVVHSTKKPPPPSVPGAGSVAPCFFEHTVFHHLLHPDRALLVGVFQNQPLEYILAQQKLLNLDAVQLHGAEPIEWARLISVPVIKSFGPHDTGLGLRGYHALPLLDAGAGGSGEKLDLAEVKAVLARDPGVCMILAGGLSHTNVRGVLDDLGNHKGRVKAVDVSSGVEEDGQQNPEKIRAFVKAAKEQ